MNLLAAKQNLLLWYETNQRPLPWRANRDPYSIWISETMLQQTTTTAVIPYFKRFMTRFPTLKSLAEASEKEVLEAWAGLGYYSRARNLRKSALALQSRGGFPETYEELQDFPGFGPYTSRSVASLAFDCSCGVVDGNVIRFFSRLYKKDWSWWKSQARHEIQTLADEWVKDLSSYKMNQALMEIGRTICTPKSPACLLCPVRNFCLAFKSGSTANYPLPKPRREREIWLWQPFIEVQRGKIRIQFNSHLPFMRNQWLLPGTARKAKAKPRKYDFKHTITHHDIFVTVKPHLPKLSSSEGKWIPLKEIKQYVPASLVQKALAHRPGALGFELFDSSQNNDGHSSSARRRAKPSPRRSRASPRRGR